MVKFKHGVVVIVRHMCSLSVPKYLPTVLLCQRPLHVCSIVAPLLPTTNLLPNTHQLHFPLFFSPASAAGWLSIFGPPDQTATFTNLFVLLGRSEIKIPPAGRFRFSPNESRRTIRLRTAPHIRSGAVSSRRQPNRETSWMCGWSWWRRSINTLCARPETKAINASQLGSEGVSKRLPTHKWPKCN